MADETTQSTGQRRWQLLPPAIDKELNSRSNSMIFLPSLELLGLIDPAEPFWNLNGHPVLEIRDFQAILIT
jgi:hypothetical protein